MNSPTHRAIITNPSLLDMGVGYVPGVGNPSYPANSNMMTYVVTFGRCAP
jgi:uncharacterized protein YkwD